MKTTFQDMLDYIKPLEWSIARAGEVRCADGRCPIVAAAYLMAHNEYLELEEEWSDDGYDTAADVLGLTIDCGDFIEAADYNERAIRLSHKHDTAKCSQIIRTRRRLLKALGLTEDELITA